MVDLWEDGELDFGESSTTTYSGPTGIRPTGNGSALDRVLRGSGAYRPVMVPTRRVPRPYNGSPVYEPEEHLEWRAPVVELPPQSPMPGEMATRNFMPRVGAGVSRTTAARETYTPPGFPTKIQLSPFGDALTGIQEGAAGPFLGLRPGDDKGGFIEGPFGVPIATTPLTIANAATWGREGLLALGSSLLAGTGRYEQQAGALFGEQVEGPADGDKNPLDYFFDGVNAIGDAVWAPFEAFMGWFRDANAGNRARDIRTIIQTGSAGGLIGPNARAPLDFFFGADRDTALKIAEKAAREGRTWDDMAAKLYDLDPAIVAQIAQNPTMTDEQLTQLVEGQPLSTDPFVNLALELGMQLGTLVAGGVVVRGAMAALRAPSMIAQGATAFQKALTGFEKLWRVNSAMTISGWGVRGGEWALKEVAGLSGNEGIVEYMDKLLWEMPLSTNPGLNLVDGFNTMYGVHLGQLARGRVISGSGQGRAGIDIPRLVRGEGRRAIIAGEEAIPELVVAGEKVALGKNTIRSLAKFKDVTLTDIQRTVFQPLGWTDEMTSAMFGDRPINAAGDMPPFTRGDALNVLLYHALSEVRDRAGDDAKVLNPAEGMSEVSIAWVNEHIADAVDLLATTMLGREGKADWLRSRIQETYWNRSGDDGSELGMIPMYGPFDATVALLQLRNWLWVSKETAKAAADVRNRIRPDWTVALDPSVDAPRIAAIKEFLAGTDPDARLSAYQLNRIRMSMPALSAHPRLNPGRRKAWTPKVTRKELEAILDGLMAERQKADVEAIREKPGDRPPLDPDNAADEAAIAASVGMPKEVATFLMRSLGGEEVVPAKIPDSLLRWVAEYDNRPVEILMRNREGALARAQRIFEERFADARMRGVIVASFDDFVKTLDRVSSPDKAVREALTEAVDAIRRPPKEEWLRRNTGAASIYEDALREGLELIDKALGPWLDDPVHPIRISEVDGIPVMLPDGVTGADMMLVAAVVDRAKGLEGLTDAHLQMLNDPAVPLWQKAAIVHPLLEEDGNRFTADEVEIVGKIGKPAVFSEDIARVMPEVTEPTHADVLALQQRAIAHWAQLPELSASLEAVAHRISARPGSGIANDVDDLIRRAMALGMEGELKVKSLNQSVDTRRYKFLSVEAPIETPWNHIRVARPERVPEAVRHAESIMRAAQGRIVLVEEQLGRLRRGLREEEVVWGATPVKTAPSRPKANQAIEQLRTEYPGIAIKALEDPAKKGRWLIFMEEISRVPGRVVQGKDAAEALAAEARAANPDGLFSVRKQYTTTKKGVTREFWVVEEIVPKRQAGATAGAPAAAPEPRVEPQNDTVPGAVEEVSPETPAVEEAPAVSEASGGEPEPATWDTAYEVVRRGGGVDEVGADLAMLEEAGVELGDVRDAYEAWVGRIVEGEEKLKKAGPESEGYRQALDEIAVSIPAARDELLAAIARRLEAETVELEDGTVGRVVDETPEGTVVEPPGGPPVVVERDPDTIWLGGHYRMYVGKRPAELSADDLAMSYSSVRDIVASLRERAGKSSEYPKVVKAGPKAEYAGQYRIRIDADNYADHTGKPNGGPFATREEAEARVDAMRAEAEARDAQRLAMAEHDLPLLEAEVARRDPDTLPVDAEGRDIPYPGTIQDAAAGYKRLRHDLRAELAGESDPYVQRRFLSSAERDLRREGEPDPSDASKTLTGEYGRTIGRIIREERARAGLPEAEPWVLITGRRGNGETHAEFYPTREAAEAAVKADQKAEKAAAKADKEAGLKPLGNPRTYQIEESLVYKLGSEGPPAAPESERAAAYATMLDRAEEIQRRRIETGERHPDMPPEYEEFNRLDPEDIVRSKNRLATIDAERTIRTSDPELFEAIARKGDKSASEIQKKMERALGEEEWTPEQVVEWYTTNRSYVIEKPAYPEGGGGQVKEVHAAKRAAGREIAGAPPAEVEPAPKVTMETALANRDRVFVNPHGLAFYIDDHGNTVSLYELRNVHGGNRADYEALVRERMAATGGKKGKYTPGSLIINSQARWVASQLPEGDPLAARLEELAVQYEEANAALDKKMAPDAAGKVVKSTVKVHEELSAAIREAQVRLWPKAPEPQMGMFDQPPAAPAPEAISVGDAVWFKGRKWQVAEVREGQVGLKPSGPKGAAHAIEAGFGPEAIKTWDAAKGGWRVELPERAPQPVVAAPEGAWSGTARGTGYGDNPGRTHRATGITVRSRVADTMGREEWTISQPGKAGKTYGSEEKMLAGLRKISPEAADSWRPPEEGIFAPAPAPEPGPVGIGVERGFPDPYDETKQIPATLRVRELGDLISDDQPGFRKELQPRDREGRITSTEQVADMARKMTTGSDESAALMLRTESGAEGAFVVDPEGQVVAGNGRARAMREAGEPMAAAMKAALVARAAEFGIDPAVIEGMKYPVLVREVPAELAGPELAAALNVATGGMAITETAARIAKAITPEDINGLELEKVGSFAEALNSERGRTFAGGILAKLTKAEQKVYLDAKGNLNQQGVQLIQAATVAKLMRDPASSKIVAAFFETPDADVARIRSGLLGAMGQMLSAQAKIDAGIRYPQLSPGDPLARATLRIMGLREQGMGGKVLVQTLDSAEMFEDAASMFDRELARVLVELKSAPEVTSFLRAYAKAVEDSADPNQLSMFDIQPRKVDIANAAVKEINTARQAAASDAIAKRQLAEAKKGGPGFDLVQAEPITVETIRPFTDPETGDVLISEARVDDTGITQPPVHESPAHATPEAAHDDAVRRVMEQGPERIVVDDWFGREDPPTGVPVTIRTTEPGWHAVLLELQAGNLDTLRDRVITYLDDLGDRPDEADRLLTAQEAAAGDPVAFLVQQEITLRAGRGPRRLASGEIVWPVAAPGWTMVGAATDIPARLDRWQRGLDANPDITIVRAADEPLQSLRATEAVVVDATPKADIPAAEYEAITGIPKDTSDADARAAEIDASPAHVVATDADANLAASLKERSGAIPTPPDPNRPRTLEFHRPDESARIRRLEAERARWQGELTKAARERAALDSETYAEVDIAPFEDPVVADAWARLTYVEDPFDLPGRHVGPEGAAPPPPRTITLGELVDHIQSIDANAHRALGINDEAARALRIALMELAERTLTNAGGESSPAAVARLERQRAILRKMRDHDAKVAAGKPSEPPPEVIDSPYELPAAMADLAAVLASRIEQFNADTLDGYTGYQIGVMPRRSKFDRSPLSPRIQYRDFTGEADALFAAAEVTIPGLGAALAEGPIKTLEKSIADARFSRSLRTFIDMAFGPRHEQAIAAETRQRLEDRIAEALENVGMADAEAIEGIHYDVAAIIKHVHQHMASNTAARLPIHRRIATVPPGQLNQLAEVALGLKHGQDNLPAWWEAIGKDFAELWRDSDNRTRAWLRQNNPGLADVVDRVWYESRVGKQAANLKRGLNVVYNVFRFSLDVRWQALEYLEPDMLLTGRWGLGAWRDYTKLLSADPKANAWRSGFQRYGPGDVPLPPFLSQVDRAKMRESWAWWGSQMEEIGVFARARDNAILAAMRRESPKLLEKELLRWARQDPILSSTLKTFGETPERWLERLARDWEFVDLQMGGWKGASEATRGRVLEQFGMRGEKLRATAGKEVYPGIPEIEAAIAQSRGDPRVVALYERLRDIQHSLYDDLAATFYGQPDRSNLQRLFNHPLLYWPISYQIKATKWLARILFDQAFGVKLGAAPAVLLQDIHDEYVRRLREDPALADQLGQHRTLLFMAQMLLPITPFDIGVSLSPFTRFALNLGNEEVYSRNLFGIGPGYTHFNLLPRLFFEESKPGGIFAEGSALEFAGDVGRQIQPYTIPVRRAKESTLQEVTMQPVYGTPVYPYEENAPTEPRAP